MTSQSLQVSTDHLPDKVDNTIDDIENNTTANEEWEVDNVVAVFALTKKRVYKLDIWNSDIFDDDLLNTLDWEIDDTYSNSQHDFLISALDYDLDTTSKVEIPEDNVSTTSNVTSVFEDLDLEWDYDFPLQSFPSISSQISSCCQTVVINDEEFHFNLQTIRPYRNIITHGGYYGDGLNGIVVLSACFLPDNSEQNFDQIMENLFLYVVFTLNHLIAGNYSIIFLSSGCHIKNLPLISWLKKIYLFINYNLHKHLDKLIIVHPSLYIRFLIAFFRPFFSLNFRKKLQIAPTLYKLADILPVDNINFPEFVIEHDIWLHVKEKFKVTENVKRTPT